jgi:hypothetical protein
MPGGREEKPLFDDGAQTRLPSSPSRGQSCRSAATQSQQIIT